MNKPLFLTDFKLVNRSEKELDTLLLINRFFSKNIKIMFNEVFDDSNEER